eukprot:847613-Amphidinium_carterae.1
MILKPHRAVCNTSQSDGKHFGSAIGRAAYSHIMPSMKRTQIWPSIAQQCHTAHSKSKPH